MKQLVFLYLLLIPFCSILGDDYSQIDKQSASVPSNLKTADEIANYLTRNLTLPEEKTRAIFYWISHTIKYDAEILNSESNRFDRKGILEDVLSKHEGVCQHFAELFNACCQSVGIQSFVISGYTHQGAHIDPLSHAWNAVLIDSKYYDLDVTWAAAIAGNADIDQYFLVSPSDFIKTHMPFDPIWQFLNNPLTNAEFESRDYSKLKTNSNYNYYDLIYKLPSLNVLERMINENNRIIKCGLTNSLVRERATLNQKNINLYQYNLAVETYNEGVDIYNSYINAKFKNFYGGNLSQEQITAMLQKSRKKLEQTETMLNQIHARNAESNNRIQSLRTSIKSQELKLNKEDVFLINYFKTWKPLRVLMN